ncbi:hypothetical protein NQ314_011013 [Rhamnusium bicolor]|uniref:Uncharacterized protein n=1 Tax=Rhamnusium bicolor TaxID=1586634 RepID=A0AAV8XKZ0_9CUCU|nr:hypothetical protein NQ314_011013 [Rhamnusium bicolor]
MAISLLNPKAEVARAAQALAINISAAKGIQDVMKSNLGPKGTVKMLVSGAGDIKITKDGNVLLHEMQIQHPTASLIARASTAQDDMTVMVQHLQYWILTDGFDIARAKALEVLEKIKLPIDVNKENLTDVCRTSLRTKVHQKLADVLTDVCVQAVLSIKQGDKPVDLHMVELMEMQHKTETDTNLVRG